MRKMWHWTLYSGPVLYDAVSNSILLESVETSPASAHGHDSTESGDVDDGGLLNEAGGHLAMWSSDDGLTPERRQIDLELDKQEGLTS